MGGEGQIPPNTKLGGMVVKQFKNTDMKTPYFTKNAFQEIDSSWTMIETYSSDMTTFSDGGFVWAAEMNATLNFPEATASGSMHHGALSYGNLPVEQGLTVDTLIENSSVTDSVTDRKFHLRSAVCNNNLITEAGDFSGRNMNNASFSAEWITYVVIVSPATTIETGGNIKFTISYEISLNGVYWTNFSDALSNGLIADQPEKEKPSQLAGIVEQAPTMKRPIWQGLKHAVNWI